MGSLVGGAAVRAARTLADLVLPRRCAGCATPGVGWCPRCAAELRAPFPVQPDRAGRLAAPPAYALGRYRGPARRAVLAYKERGRRALAAPFGRALAAAAPLVLAIEPAGCGRSPVRLDGVPPGSGTSGEPPGVALVPVPSRPGAARRRGGPHMVGVARACAAALAESGYAVAVAPALRLDARVRDSVGLDARARAANLAGRMRPVRQGLPPPGVPVLLLDDVITTGATMSACAAVLADAGVAVRAVLALTAVPPNG